MGKMSMENIEFTVFGNGRVRCRVVDAGGRHRVLDEFERDIGPAQVQELVETAVQSGLADFDAHGYVEQIQKAGGRVPQNEDGVDVLFKIELDHSSHSFLLDSPDEFARRFPSDARFRSLDHIIQVLGEIHREHRRLRPGSHSTGATAR